MQKIVVTVALVATASMAAVGIAPVASASRPTADGVSAAKAIVAKYSKTPTSIGKLEPITKPIPKGKYIIAVTGNTDAGIELNNYQIEAGKLLGWNVESSNVPGTIEAQRQGLQQAIAKNPDGISVSGMEPESYGDLYKMAEKKGIVIVCSACMSKPYAALKSTDVAGPKGQALYGQMIAAYTVANVKGTPNVQMFGTSVYPILRAYDLGYQRMLKRLSPNSVTTFNELDFAGIPQQVANNYKANPATNFISSDLGDFFIGVAPAIATVGGQPGTAPMIGGLTAGKDAIQSLKNKTTNAWTAYPLPIVSYRVIDEFARYWTKLPFAKADLPTQILTQQNANSLVLTKKGDYLGVKDYQAQFKKVWGLK